MSKIIIKENVTRGITLTFGFALFVPFVETSAKLLGDTISPPQITFTRFLLHMLIFSIFIYFYIPKDEWIAKPSWPLILRGALASLGTLFVYAGLAVMPLVDAVAIFFMQPLILTSLSAILLREKVGPYRWSAVGIGMLGALMVIGPNFENIGWGAVFPALAALFHGLSALIARRWADAARLVIFQYYVAITAVLMTGALFILASFANYEAIVLRVPNNFEWGLLGVIAFGSIITNLLLTQAFRVAPASVIAPFLYLQIIGSVIMGFFVFQQLPSSQTIIGAILVIGAGLVIWWRERTLKLI